jgi:drug/metabolite transporter (DMT)-like permease
MIYMALFGWLVFGQTPNLHVIVGTILVIGSGLYLWFQEIHQENK